MTFFQDYMVWMDWMLSTFLSAKVALVAAAIEPAAISMFSLYVIFMGYRAMTESVGPQLIMDWAIKLVVLGVVMLVSLRLALYSTVVIDTFVNGPNQLSAAIAGNRGTAAATLDHIWSQAQSVGEVFLTKGGIFNGNAMFYMAAAAVYILVGACIVYTMFLLTLSSLAVHVLLALGPLFIVFVLFNATRPFFSNWLSVLTNYALIGVLATLFTTLMLSSLAKWADGAVVQGHGLTVAGSFALCFFAVLLLLVMKQVPAMAAGLASGLALSSFGLLSGIVGRTIGHTGQFARGLTDKSWGRHDSAARLIGHGTTAAVSATGRRLRPRQKIPAVMPPPNRNESYAARMTTEGKPPRP